MSSEPKMTEIEKFLKDAIDYGEKIIIGVMKERLSFETIRDALAAKDAEIARLREALEKAYREGYRDACEIWNSWSNEDELWEVSDARRALEEDDEY